MEHLRRTRGAGTRKLVAAVVIATMAGSVAESGETGGRAVLFLLDQAVSADLRGLSFTDAQEIGVAPATRSGLRRWAATAQGKALLSFFAANRCEIVIREDPAEAGIGAAPQPGIATFAATADATKRKRFEVILNPSSYRIPEGMVPLAGQAVTPADMMAAACAAEMLHVYFYARGIPLPHHVRADFQEKWREVASQLGFPLLRHGEDDGVDERHGPPLRIVIH